MKNHLITCLGELQKGRDKVNELIASADDIVKHPTCSNLTHSLVFSATVLLRHASGDYDGQIAKLKRQISNMED